MFAEELKVEFLERVSIILDTDDLSKGEKISAIGKVFAEFEKKNKFLLKANIPPLLDAIRYEGNLLPTIYSLRKKWEKQWKELFLVRSGLNKRQCFGDMFKFFSKSSVF